MPHGWDSICADFRAYHQRPFNVLAHLVTTPLCFAAAFGLALQLLPGTAVAVVVLVYAASMVPFVPAPLVAATAALLAASGFAAMHFAEWGLWWCAALFAVGYFGQDLAHLLSSEQTFQSAYQGKPGWVWTLLEHTYYLLPLSVDAALHADIGVLWLPRHEVVYGKVGPEMMKKLENLAAWALSQKPSEHHTTHWWPEDLPAAKREEFLAVVHSSDVEKMFREVFPAESYAMEPVHGMNEVYVATKVLNNNSDTTFYMDHIDGPYGLIPFGKVYRCMLGITPNTEISTMVPTLTASTGYTLSTGELLGFDFNREVHRIELAKNFERNEGQRIALKLHYVVYPRALKPVGDLVARLTCNYNNEFRNLYNYTVKSTKEQREENDANRGALHQLVYTWHKKLVKPVTWLFRCTEQHVGFANLTYLLALGLLSACTSYHVFLAGSSFYHYGVYMAAYARSFDGVKAGGVAYGKLTRDALLFKSLALAQASLLLLPRLAAAGAGTAAASLLCILAGHALTFAAFVRIGVERTYFGWELGLVHEEWSAKFPYGTVPHPMIVGGLLAWAGHHLVPGFRADYPYLAPIHMLLYAAHLAQEHVTIQRALAKQSAKGKGD